MFDYELDEYETELSGVNECSVCEQLSMPRECKRCGMDTCALCVACEYCE